jgi:hypothetical protein
LDAASGHRPGRNDPCHCGSGKKYKQCCLEKDAAAARAARAQAPATAETAASASGPASPPRRPRNVTAQPWKRGATNTRGFTRTSLPRKVGGG